MPPKRATPAAASSSSAPPPDKDKVMAPVKRLRAAMPSSSATEKRTLEDVGVTGVTKEVRVMERQEVMAEIEAICLQAVASVMRGEGFSYTMPARTAANHLYIPELDRLVLRDKMLRSMATADVHAVFAPKAHAASQTICLAHLTSPIVMHVLSINMHALGMECSLATSMAVDKRTVPSQTQIAVMIMVLGPCLFSSCLLLLLRQLYLRLNSEETRLLLAHVLGPFLGTPRTLRGGQCAAESALLRLLLRPDLNRRRQFAPLEAACESFDLYAILFGRIEAFAIESV